MARTTSEIVNPSKIAVSSALCLTANHPAAKRLQVSRKTVASDKAAAKM